MVNFKRNRRSGNKVVRQVFKNKAVLSRMKGSIERKQRVTVVTTNQPADTTSKIIYLTLVNQGDAEETRDGNKIRLKSLFIRGFIHNDNSGTPEDGLVRIIVWRENAHNAVATNPTLVNNVLETLTINSPQSWSRKNINKVMFDNTFVLDTSQHTIIPFKIRLSGLNTSLFYEGSTSAVADAIKNPFFIGVFGTVAAGTNAPQFDITCRMTYDDL